HARVALGCLDGQLAAKDLVGRRQRVLEVFPFAVAALADDLADGQVARVQVELGGGLVEPVQRQRGTAVDHLPVEVDLEVEGEVLDLDLVGFGVRVLVDHVRGSGSCGRGGGGRLVGIGRRGVALAAGGDGQHGREGQHQDRMAHGSCPREGSAEFSAPTVSVFAPAPYFRQGRQGTPSRTMGGCTRLTFLAACSRWPSCPRLRPKPWPFPASTATSSSTASSTTPSGPTPPASTW